VVKKNLVAAKLTGDDPPTAAENLKLLLTLNADAKFEAFTVPSASSTSRTGSLRPTTMMGLRSVSAVGSQELALGRRSF
jgi:hypothetical protein